MFKQLKNDESGLTLIELTIVIAILGILAAFIAPQVITAIDDAKVGKAKLEIANMGTALSNYNLDVGTYPSTEQGLDALWQAPSDVQNWGPEPYLTTPITKDPWGNEYQYRYPGSHYGVPYDLFSYGKDGKLDGEDLNADITNWVEVETDSN